MFPKNYSKIEKLKKITNRSWSWLQKLSKKIWLCVLMAPITNYWNGEILICKLRNKITLISNSFVTATTVTLAPTIFPPEIELERKRQLQQV